MEIRSYVERPNPDPIKRRLSLDLFSLLRTAGLTVQNVNYGIVDGEEVYTIRMRSGCVYTVNVSADSPMAAVADVVNFMKHK